MKYIDDLALWTQKRRVRATDQGQEPSEASAFQPTEFSSEALGTFNAINTETSALEALVNLFTGEDPMEMNFAQTATCGHNDGTECDCPPVTIEIPTVLAYHTHQLSSTLETHDQRFKEFKNGNGDTVRKSPDHRGKMAVSLRAREGGVDDIAVWERFEVEEPEARLKILERWCRTGIMLKQALRPGCIQPTAERKHAT